VFQVPEKPVPIETPFCVFQVSEKPVPIETPCCVFHVSKKHVPIETPFGVFQVPEKPVPKARGGNSEHSEHLWPPKKFRMFRIQGPDVGTRGKF